jgi:hypothetical protein
MKVMGKILAAHQPHFWPWLGYLDKWQRADVLVVLDDVDFPRQDFVHRNRILVAGRAHWLTLPVEKRPRGTAIREMRVASNLDWRRVHLETLHHVYPQASPSLAMGLIEDLYRCQSPWLMDWCLASMDLLRSGCLHRHVGRLVFSSTTVIAPGLAGTARLVALCQTQGATTYLSGMGAKAYLEERQFAAAGIAVRWLDRKPPGSLSALHYLLTEDLASLGWLQRGAAEDEASGHAGGLPEKSA